MSLKSLTVLCFSLIFLACYLPAICQTDSLSITEDILAFQKKLNDEFKSDDESPLKPSDKRKFKGHNFYPINLKYRVLAKFIPFKGESTFYMPTTTDRKAVYLKFGELHFTIDQIEYKLNVYQSPDISLKEGYKDYLFLPFKDLTNGDQSYEGGRFIDLRISPSDEMILDFNKAYNPYCAYNHIYSCPIPPSENRLKVEIPAGIKKYK